MSEQAQTDALLRRNTTVFDMKQWLELGESCNKLDDIISRVEDKRTNNMFVVVDLLMYVTYLNSPTTEEAEIFVNSLANICQDLNPLKKISPRYIDSIIAALELSPQQEKVQLIALLKEIKNNDTFSSCRDNIILSVTTDKEIKVELTTGNVCKVPFEFKHPGTPECHMSGKCGFIIKLSTQGGYWKRELCKQDTDYNGTGLHLHEIVSAEEMYYYWIWSGTTREGNTVRRPGKWGWRKWFPNVSDWELEQHCVSYNVSVPDKSPEKSTGSATTLTTSAVTTVQVAHVPHCRNTTVNDEKEWMKQHGSCNKLEDITSRVQDKRINNMFVVVDVLLQYVKQYTTGEAEVFINRLENICQDIPLKKISPVYIDSIISALKKSLKQEKVQLIALLKKIKNNDTFSSCHDNVILRVPLDEAIKVTRKIPFEFKHPGTPECHMSGRCGFIIKRHYGYNMKYELCTQDTDYNGTGLHLHEIVSAEDMHFEEIHDISITELTKEDIVIRTYTLMWGQGNTHRWFSHPGRGTTKKSSSVVQFCVYYNVSSYLVAKQD